MMLPLLCFRRQRCSPALSLKSSNVSAMSFIRFSCGCATMVAACSAVRKPLVELAREAAYLEPEDGPPGAGPDSCWEQA